MTHAKSVALVVAVTLAGIALAVGAAGAQELTEDDVNLSVEQADDGSATVTVADNGTGIENATVTVETVDNTTYEGTGEYTTDENGTVGLPAPEENVTVAVTAEVENVTVSTEANLTIAEEDNETSFGQLVSAFIQELHSDNETEGGIGGAVSEFVLENNPAADKIPGHAGPPENGTGPPEHAGPSDNGTGPPEHAGPDGDKERGPPEDAGPGGDDTEADEEEDEEEDDDEEADEEDDDEEDDDSGQGPPDHAGP